MAVVVGVTAVPWLAMRVPRPASFAGDSRSVPTRLADELNRTLLHHGAQRERGRIAPAVLPVAALTRLLPRPAAGS